MLNHSLIAAALAVMLAAPAFAQQPEPGTILHKQTQPAPATTGGMPDGVKNQNNMSEKGADAQPAGFMQGQDANEWRGTKLIGASVYGPDQKSIGDINDVLISKDGRVTAVIVGVGGFLGVGEKYVALPFNALDIQHKDGVIGRIAVNYTRNQLKSAPNFAFYKGVKTETTGLNANGGMKRPLTPTVNPDSQGNTGAAMRKK